MPITLLHRYFFETVANHNRTWLEVQCLSYKEHIASHTLAQTRPVASQMTGPGTDCGTGAYIGFCALNPVNAL
jgi:hypothetical protein